MKNLLKKTNNIFLLVALLFVFQNNVVFGQEDQTVAGMSGIVSISATPAAPGPGESVDLTLISYSVNLDSSKIIWYVDGVATKEGYGEKSMTVIAKKNGENTIIKATAENADGIIVEATKEISPASVDIIIEPITYTPPFYQGKQLFVAQSQARLIAMPNIVVDGKSVNSDNLVFKWSKNGIVLGSESGLGKNSIIIEGSIPIRDIEVGLQVLNTSGKVVAATSKTILVNSPKIVFYEENSLYGILFNKSLNNGYYLGLKEEVDVIAKPFFFSFTSDVDNDALYKWYLNGNYIAPSGRKNLLVLKQTNTELKGTAKISLDLSNSTNIFQYTSGSFGVTFGQ